ncbi:hypothetical protein LshimejAT787_0407990 [Lyophyllum shimeji]|uniref:Uncharacterized protein n=1 Tax=Lyophyllum shimeji TaxID=47721 RepID=A0A9P3ULL3_LYOSH|nr:hypothetical protein LshimejAT787_0407990 [Lyophyllum shimeji]
MSSPFELPRHSGYSHSPCSCATQKSARTPIHNPYDKFTQQEFDAWIGGITGALRRALGHEDEVESQLASRHKRDDASFDDGEEVQRRIEEEEEGSVDAELEDSFADYTTRRVGKGKARDPREGPGLGKGDKNEPIFIASDSEEEEQAEDLAQIEDVYQEEEGSEEWEEGSQSGEEREESWGRGESSAQARIRHDNRRLDVEEEEEEEEEEEAEEEEEYDEEYDEEAEPSGQEDENAYVALSPKKAPSPVVVLSSDEEEQGEVEVEAHSVSELDEKDSGDEYLEEDRDTGTSMLIRKNYLGTARPPRHRARKEYAHQASSPVAEDLGDAEEVDEIEEDDQDVQLLDDTTSYPPRTVALGALAMERRAEIRDLWSGPDTYAEDYHSGGAIREPPDDLAADDLGPGDEGERPTEGVADSEEEDVMDVCAVEEESLKEELGPSDEGEVLTEGVAHPEEKDVIDLDEVEDRPPEEAQPSFEDTSFPPRDDAIEEAIPSDRLIEIPDQWEGPNTFAEDYYSGGDVTSQGDPGSAHYLGLGDEIAAPTPDPSNSVVEIEHRASTEAVETFDLVQQSVTEESTSLSGVVAPDVSQIDYPVELSERLEAPVDNGEAGRAGDDIQRQVVDTLSADLSGAGGDADAPTIIDSADDLKDDTTETQRVAPEAVPEPSIEFEHGGDLPGESPEVIDTCGGGTEVEEQTQPTSSAARSPVRSTAFETTQFDFGGLYDDMEVEVADFGDPRDTQHQSVDLSPIDWAYAAALLNGLPTSGVDQQRTPEVTAGELAGADKAEPQGEVAEAAEDSPRAVELVETVPTTLEPSIETVEDTAEEAAAVVDVAVAPVEEPIVLDAPAVPSLEQPQTPAQSTSIRHHEFGLPTPPSERPKDLDLSVASEQAVASGANEANDSEIVILESSDPLADTLNTSPADVSNISEVEPVRPGEVADDDAQGEVAVDADAVREPEAYDETEETLPREQILHDFSVKEAQEGAATTLVNGVCDGNAVRSDDAWQAIPRLAESAEADMDTSTPLASERDAKVEETTTANGDTGAISSDDVHVFSSQNGIPTPVVANAAVPDPTSRPRTSTSPPPILSLPGSPSFTSSPAETSATVQPTPVSVSLPASILKALRVQQSHPGSTYNGLFTPDPAVDSGPASPGPALVQTENLLEAGVAGQSATSGREPVAIDESLAETSHPLESGIAIVTTQAQSASLDVVVAQDTTAGRAMAEAEHAQQSEPELSSYALGPPPRRQPPSAPYSLSVVMRKATDPVLFSDPYPASLSTPENVITYLVNDTQDEECEEDHSQDTSVSSSSTGDKELEEKVDGSILEDDEDNQALESLELRYPSLQPVSQEAVSTTTAVEDGTPGVDEWHEADADGDIDPDFIENAPTAHKPTPPPASRQENADDARIPEPTEDVTPAAKAGESDKETQEQELSQPQDSRPAPVVGRASDAPTMPASSSKSADDLPSILIIKQPATIQAKPNDADDSSDALTDLDEPPRSPAKSKTSRPTKRKRSSSIQATSPVTRSMSLKQPEKRTRTAAKPRGSNGKKVNNRSSLAKDKGKGREVHQPSARKGSFDTRSISSRSSSDASSALRMLYTSSQNTSRASSVVSNATSDNSLYTVHPSPTLHKGSSFRHQVPPPPPPPPPPLLHRHHRPQPTLTQPSRPPASQKAPPPSRQSGPPPSEAVANKPSTSSQPATSRRSSVYSSSPVTRSNCRYHKISIPKSDDGPRVFFLVPGCSLGNRELLEEEEIVDHGDALPEDGLRMTHDLDAYDFDPCLLNSLRLLVGVDLLREQEVYYLPQLGPDLVPLRRRNEVDDKASFSKTSSRDLASAADHPGPAGMSSRRNSVASAISPPSSLAGSTSTSASAIRPLARSDVKPSSVISYSGSELTEEEASPNAKRPKLSTVEAKSTISNMGPPDAQPERSRRSKGSKQSIKRSRTSDVVRESEMDTQRAKKQKTGSSDLRGMT